MSDWSATREFYRSNFWQRLSHRVRTRDRWTCRRCSHRATGSWGRRRMQAHHLVSRPHVSHATSLDVEHNLITLCADCHRAVHGLPVWGQARHNPVTAVVVMRAPRAPRAARPTSPARPHRPHSFRR